MVVAILHQTVTYVVLPSLLYGTNLWKSTSHENLEQNLESCKSDYIDLLSCSLPFFNTVNCFVPKRRLSQKMCAHSKKPGKSPRIPEDYMIQLTFHVHSLSIPLMGSIRGSGRMRTVVKTELTVKESGLQGIKQQQQQQNTPLKKSRLWDTARHLSRHT